MTAFDLPEELKPPEESAKYEKVKNPWAGTSFGKSEYYWRKIPDTQKRYSGETPNQPSEKTRKKVRERDGFECQNCSSESSLEVHHIVPLMVGGSNKRTNLVTLCRDCHDKVPHPHESGESECCANKIENLIENVVEIKSNMGKPGYEESPLECKNCGEEGEPYNEIEAHFIVPLWENGSPKLENITLLCSVCHSAAHGRRKYARTASQILNSLDYSPSFPEVSDDN